MATTQRNLYCKLQNRLGALDRVVLALTHRGIVPEQLITRRNDERTLEVAACFDCESDHEFAKLVKFLQKQVYVLEANSVDVTEAEKESQAARDSDKQDSKVAQLFTNHEAFSQRRLANAHNA